MVLSHYANPALEASLPENSTLQDKGAFLIIENNIYRVSLFSFTVDNHSMCPLLTLLGTMGAAAAMIGGGIPDAASSKPGSKPGAGSGNGITSTSATSGKGAPPTASAKQLTVTASTTEAPAFTATTEIVKPVRSCLAGNGNKKLDPNPVRIAIENPVIDTKLSSKNPFIDALHIFFVTICLLFYMSANIFCTQIKFLR